jgi:hypothetical protein
MCEKKDMIQLYRMNIKLNEKCVKEREILCNQIIKILELNKQESFLLCDLEKDKNKQTQILELKEEIKQHFDLESHCSYLDMIRTVFRQQHHIFIGFPFTIKNNEFPKNTYKYLFYRKK